MKSELTTIEYKVYFFEITQGYFKDLIEKYVYMPHTYTYSAMKCICPFHQK